MSPPIFPHQLTGDGSIEEDEFVGFLEGQLDPESQNMLVDSALSMSASKRHKKSTLVVDQILCSHHLGTDEQFSTSPTIISFITILQELERLYIYRRAYQQKVRIFVIMTRVGCLTVHLPLIIIASFMTDFVLHQFFFFFFFHF